MRRVVCAAIRNGSLDIICSARHFDEVMRMQIQSSKADWSSHEQGFIDQFGVFITRAEAWEIAQAAEQIRRRVGGNEREVLYSENLY